MLAHHRARGLVGAPPTHGLTTSISFAGRDWLSDPAVVTPRNLGVRRRASLPYANMNMWSSENAGTLDFNAELELWTKAGHIKIKLGKAIDIRRLDTLIASVVLATH